MTYVFVSHFIIFCFRLSMISSLLPLYLLLQISTICFGQYSFSGVIYDDVTESSISGATISFLDLISSNITFSVSDSHGDYQARLIHTDYEITVTAGGYAPLTRFLTVSQSVPKTSLASIFFLASFPSDGSYRFV